MAIQYDPRLQGRQQNTTDILGGQQPPQDAQAAPEAPQQRPMQQPAQAQQQAPQSNLATKKPSSSSGMYTNVQQYAAKNQPASEKMAKSIGQTVQRSADIARKNIQATRQQFENLRESGSLQNRGQAVQDVTSAAQAAATGTPQVAKSRAIGPEAYKDQLGDSYNQFAEEFSNLKNKAWATKAYGPDEISPQQQAYKDLYNKYEIDPTATRPQQEGLSDADKRLKAILDAKYAGPQQMQELGSFGETQRRTQEAGRLTRQLTGGNRQELLDKSLERQGSRYTQGSRRLDELLFGQGKPQEQLEQAQQQIGNVGQDLTSARQSARQDAIQRAQELRDIRSQSREALQSTAAQRAQQVEDYIQGQKDVGQELSDYYKNTLTGGTTFDEKGNLVDAEGNKVDASGLELGALEAASLGLQSGTGLYNQIRNQQEREALLAAFDPSRLRSEQMVTKDQQGQLAELQRLAELGEGYGAEGSGLDFRSAYQDAEKAGTQTASSAADLDAFRENLTSAEKAFRESAAQDVTGVGRGSAKYGSWWNEGKTRKTAYKTANLKDILEKQGYDFSDESLENAAYDKGVSIDDLSKLARGENLDLSDAYDLADVGEDALKVALTGPMGSEQLMGLLGLQDFTFGNIGSKVGETVQSLGKDIGGNLIGGSLGGLVESGLGAIGGGITDLAEGIFGKSKSAAKRKALRQAQSRAISNLKSKLTGKLSSSGFDQRVNIADTEQTQQRQQDLMDILSRINSQG